MRACYRTGDQNGCRLKVSHFLKTYPSRHIFPLWPYLYLRLIKILLESRKHSPDLFWLSQIGHGVGNRVMVLEP